MRGSVAKYMFFGLLIAFTGIGMTSCAHYCPGVDGTGNSASRKKHISFATRNSCPGNTSTGTSKPKVKRKKEDGLTSAKMERQMAKSKKSKAGPLENKTLSVDQ